MAQRPAPHIEPFTHRVQRAAMVFAIAPVREHEPCGTEHAAWQGIPAIEVESALVNTLFGTLSAIRLRLYWASDISVHGNAIGRLRPQFLVSSA